MSNPSRNIPHLPLYGALSKAVKSQNIEMLDALNANAETRARIGELDKIKKEIRGEIMEDIRTLLLELLGSGDGVPVRVDSKAVRRR